MHRKLLSLLKLNNVHGERSFFHSERRTFSEKTFFLAEIFCFELVKTANGSYINQE